MDHWRSAPARSAGPAYEEAHVAVDYVTRSAYAEVLPNEKPASMFGYPIPSEAWCVSQAIERRRLVSNNCSAYRSKPLRQACEVLGLTLKRTRTYTPRTNGKTERFIKSLLHEWANGLSFHSSGERTDG